jgi:ribonuclease HI
MGRGTNNLGELMALFYLLKFVLDRGINSLQVFSDSLMVIKWMRNKHRSRNLELFVVVEQLKLIVGNFQDLRFTHIFRETKSRS